MDVDEQIILSESCRHGICSSVGDALVAGSVASRPAARRSQLDVLNSSSHDVLLVTTIRPAHQPTGRRFFDLSAVDPFANCGFVREPHRPRREPVFYTAVIVVFKTTQSIWPESMLSEAAMCSWLALTDRSSSVSIMELTRLKKTWPLPRTGPWIPA
jgi:hypothetical protein